MKLILLESSLFDRYEKFLINDDRSLFYYSIKYKIFLEKLLSCESQYWIVLYNDEIIGVLPLMFKKGDWGTVINSLPFYGSHGGIFTENLECFEMLANKYNEIISKEDIISSNLITYPFGTHDYKKIKYDLTDYRIGLFSDIKFEKDNPDILIESFHSKTRNLIKKGIKNITEIKIENNKFDFLEKVHNENMSAVGVKPKSNQFFRLIKDSFIGGEDYNIYVAYIYGIPVCALLLYYFNKTVEYFVPAIVTEYRTLQPLSALIYKAMTDASERGYLYWNWGGTQKNQENIYHFKIRWNTKAYKYYYFNKVNNKDICSISPDKLLKEYENFYVLNFNQINSL